MLMLIVDLRHYGDNMAVCTQEITRTDNIKNYEKIRKKVEFAEKFLETLRMRNRIDNDEKIKNNPQERMKIIFEYKRLMVESLQI